MIPNTTLTLSDLRTWVRLGCSDQEKHHTQMVSFTIELNFKKPPIGTLTDDLDNTVCYVAIAENIKTLCALRRFNLIEHLAAEAAQAVLPALESQKSNIATVKITLKKPSPPLEGLHGGVLFTYCFQPE